MRPVHKPVWALLAALLAALLLQACSEGYPSEDAPLLSPYEMHNEQRVAALNDLGTSSRRDGRWRFELIADCQLQRIHKPPGGREVSEVFALQRSMEVAVIFDRAAQTFDVRLMPGAEPGEPVLGVLLKSRAWTEATQAHLLLQLLLRDCAAAGRPPPG